MKLSRQGISTTMAAAAAVIVAVVALGGAYLVISSGSAPPTVAGTISSTGVISTSSPPPAGTTIQGAGSTLVYPLMSAWSFAYQQVSNNQVNYASVGSGQGIASITAGTVSFGASDAPLTAAQYAALPSGSTLLTIAESDSGIVPAYNIPASAGVTAPIRFSGGVLARIFLGNISMWNDPAIAALNPGVTLPSRPIAVVHRSDGSGTMYAFTNFLSDSNAFWKANVGTSTLVKWPTGLACRGNEGVAGCIANTPYSLGPLEIAYEVVNKGLVSYGSVQNAAGNFVLANITNIQAAVSVGAESVPTGNASWTGYSIINNIFNDTKDKGIYPITTFTYMMLYQDQSASYAGSKSQAVSAATLDFIWWVVNSGQSAGTSLGYPPLPANVVAADDATLMKVTYNGTPLHVGS